MSVSAVIPCYNAQNTIARAIESVMDQTLHVNQIIVIDDGSTDNSLDIITALQQRNSAIEIITQSNKGVCDSRNKGIDKADGDYILMLDADDYFEPSFVEKALEKFGENQNCAAVMCGYVRVVAGKKIKPYIPPKITLPSCLLNNGAIACLLFRKDVLVKAGGYDISMTDGYEDWDLNIRILKLGYEYSVVDEVLFNYTDRHHSRSHDAARKDTEYCMKLYYKHEAAYVDHGAYIFEGLIRQQNILKTKVDDIIQTRSFKLGNTILSSARSFINFFKLK